MAASSVFVVASSIRLRRFGATSPPGPAQAACLFMPRGAVMPGMNSGLDLSDPTVVAAFKAALVHQGLIALLIFVLLGLAWITIRAGLPAAVAPSDTAQAAAPARAEPGGGCCGSASARYGSSTESCRPSRRWRSGCRRRSSRRPRRVRRPGSSTW